MGFGYLNFIAVKKWRRERKEVGFFFGSLCCFFGFCLVGQFCEVMNGKRESPDGLWVWTKQRSIHG